MYEMHRFIDEMSRAGLRRARRLRRVQIGLLAFWAAAFARQVAISGDIFPMVVAPAVITTGLFSVFCSTRSINRAKRELRQPDYFYISAMELEIYGQEFDHKWQ